MEKLFAGSADCNYATGFGVQPAGVALDPSSGVLYVTNGESDTATICRVPPGQGACAGMLLNAPGLNFFPCSFFFFFCMLFLDCCEASACRCMRIGGNLRQRKYKRIEREREREKEIEIEREREKERDR